MSDKPASVASWAVRVLAGLAFVAGAARFMWSGFLPATRELRGDFAAVFPTEYFARLRPDFPTDSVWAGWTYGPVLHFLTLPLLLLPNWSMVPKVWAVTNLLALAGCFVMTLRLSATTGKRSGFATVLLAGLWMLYQPLVNCFAQGNIEIVEMTLLLAGLVALSRARPHASGLLLGLATMTKFLPGGFLLWLLARRQWRALMTGMAAILVIAAVTQITLRWEENGTGRDLLTAFSRPIAGAQQLSLTSLFEHRAGMMDGATGEVLWFPSLRNQLAGLAGGLASALLLVACGLALLRYRAVTVSPAEIAVLFIVMLLVPPWSHDYYYVFALIPFSFLFLRGMAERNAWLITVAVAAYCLISPPIPWGWLDSMRWTDTPFVYVVGYFNLPIFGGLLLLTAAIQLLLREGPPATGAARSSSIGWRVAAAGLAVVVIASAVVVVARSRGPVRDDSPATIVDLALIPAADVAGPWGVAVSPDGKHLAYIASVGSVQRLCVREVDRSSDSTCVEENGGAAGPFFSPTGEWVGFFSGDRLMKVRSTGGATEQIATALGGRLASWADDGTIVFTGPAGILRVPATGGTPAVAIRLRPAHTAYLSPQIIDGTGVVIYSLSAATESVREGMIVAESLRFVQKTPTPLFRGSQPHYSAATGQLLYAAGGRLLAVPFDPRSLTATDLAAPVVSALRTTAAGGGQFAVGGDTVVFAAGGPVPASPRTLVWVDRQGRVSPLPLAPAGFESPRLSPDGRTVLMVVSDIKDDLWTYDLEGRHETRLTFDADRYETPLWTPDGARITFATAFAAPGLVVTLPSNGLGAQNILWSQVRPRVRLSSWSPDGRFLAATQPGDRTRRNIVAFDVERKEARTLVATPGDDYAGVFSPDGRWLAYVSDESGRPEVYVRDFPAFARQWQVSTDGGSEPRWRQDGGELYFRIGDRMMAATVMHSAIFSATAPRILFRGQYEPGESEANYDVTSDGKRFLMVQREPMPLPPLHLLRRWPALR